VKTTSIAPDLFLFIGDTYQSNSTIFISDEGALLVDAVASDSDAEALRDFVERDLRKDVRLIISTHYFSDHLAALKYFPNALIAAHEKYLETFESEQFRSGIEASHFVAPQLLISDHLSVRWGRHSLNISHNPGHTSSTLAIHVPEADLLMVGDTLVNNIVYLRYSTPPLLEQALERLRKIPANNLISSHGEVRSVAAISYASHYLQALAKHVKRSGARHELKQLQLEDCLPANVPAVPFERIFHERNLETIIERRLFA
jgi:cyclase